VSDDLHERARKVFPQYGEGPLVKVGWAPNQAEAELIAGLLLEEGVPAVIKRAGGFDVPDFLAAGPRDVLVAASGADRARDILADLEGPREIPVQGRPEWVRALAVLVIVVLLSTALAGVLAIFVD
jgi:hypothetical protein